MILQLYSYQLPYLEKCTDHVNSTPTLSPIVMISTILPTTHCMDPDKPNHHDLVFLNFLVIHFFLIFWLQSVSYHIWNCAQTMLLEYRKVTRLGIEPRPSGHIPDALTTELSSLVGFNPTMNFMYLPPQIMVTSHPQRTIQSTIDHQGQPNDDSATTT